MVWYWLVLVEVWFGSGWVWLCAYNDGDLVIATSTNEASPITVGYYPIMGIDVWEHSYYLDYKWERGEYVEEYWSLVDWDMIEMFYIDFGMNNQPVEV